MSKGPDEASKNSRISGSLLLKCSTSLRFLDTFAHNFNTMLPATPSKSVPPGCHWRGVRGHRAGPLVGALPAGSVCATLRLVTFEEMSPSERILYVQELWDRIAEEPESVPVSEEWKTELGRRLEAHRADPAAAIPWEQVKARLRQQP